MSIRTLTQEDPIGLAGGLNLYGFAGGDPINFWDPYGLSADSVLGDPDAVRHVQRAVNVYRNMDTKDVAMHQKGDLTNVVEQYDKVKSSETDHLYVQFGSCSSGAGCYDPDTQTITLDLEGMEAQQHVVERRPITVAGHELGHFLDWRRYNGARGDLVANPMENLLRRALGMGRKGQPIRP